MPPEIRISVVICAYTMDRWVDICDAVASLFAQTRPADEIVLVIDHNDALLARAQQMNWTGVLVIPNAHAQGLSGGRNTGIAATTGELVVFLDDDAVAHPNWLEVLAVHAALPDVLGCSSTISPLWIGQRPRWFPEEFMWTVGCTYRGLPTEGGDVRNLLGGTMLIRRTVFDAVGGFSALLGRNGGSLISCEETELCLRARAALPQGRFLFVPQAQVGHKVPSGRMTWRYFRRRCFAEGQSKAYLVRLVQNRDALGTERDYVLRILTRGVLSGFADALMRFDPSGAARAFAIVFGLATTVAGYAMSLLRRRKIRTEVSTETQVVR